LILVRLAGAYEPAATAPVRSGLPVVHIQTFGQPITNRQSVRALITILETNSAATVCQGEIRVRGNSSAMHPQKPYRLELQDDMGHDLKLPLAGLPKDSDWILYPA
jgi:hypothetical protein